MTLGLRDLPRALRVELGLLDFPRDRSFMEVSRIEPSFSEGILVLVLLLGARLPLAEGRALGVRPRRCFGCFDADLFL